MDRRLRRVTLAALLPSVALTLAGCGSSAPGVAADPPQGCHSIVMSTVEQVAERAYAEVAGGRLIATSRLELARASALTGAVASGDPGAATQAARQLLANTQISFLRVQRGRRVLVNLGDGPAVAGASGALSASGQMVGRFVLAVQGDAGYAAVVHGLTGAAVIVRQGSRTLAGTLSPGPPTIPDSGAVRYRGVSYLAYSFTAPAYPAGSERISLLAGPSLFGACAPTAAQTLANVLGPLAVRVYAHETSSHSEQAAVAYIQQSPAFASAVAAGDPAGTRAAIITFFRSHRHIVRVRALRSGRVVDDVGGPYVLAPVSGTLRQRGRVVGSFVTAIQDDAGYVALTRIYTGAQVILRVGTRQVPSSTLDPGPESIPDRGSISYGGRRYEAYSFDGQAFPAGTLRVSLLVPIAG
jgi:hypothetical protein